MANEQRTVTQLKKVHSYFEKTKSTRGIYKISDGVTCDAIFCMADLHRELPKILQQKNEVLSPEAFLAVMKSAYARKKDLRVNSYRRKAVTDFQRHYSRLVKQVSTEFQGGDLQKTLLEMMMRASTQNHGDRITGDGVLHVTTSLIRNHRKLKVEKTYQVIEKVVEHQIGKCEIEDFKKTSLSEVDQIALRNLKAIRNYRDGF